MEKFAVGGIRRVSATFFCCCSRKTRNSQFEAVGRSTGELIGLERHRRSAALRMPGSSRHAGKFVALQGDGEPRVTRLRSMSFRSSSSASSPLFLEARCFVERLQGEERFAERQRVAHQLATTLAELHANSQDDDALELLKHIQTIGTSMDIPLVQSLLQLAADAGEVQPPDAFTVQLVLSCLTNMCVGSGIESILTEREAIRVLVNWLLDTEQRTRDYALACIFNLASTTERRLQRCRATLLDLLITSGVQSTLRRAVRQGTGDTAEYAQTTLNYMLSRRTELARRARLSSECKATPASPHVLPARRSASFDYAPSDLPLLDDDTAEADDEAANATRGGSGGWLRRRSGGYESFDDHASSDVPLTVDGTFTEADDTQAEADAIGGMRLGARLRRRSGDYAPVIMAVIAPEWASDVACIAGSDAEVVTAVASLASPISHRDLRPRPALPTATFAPDQHASDDDLGSAVQSLAIAAPVPTQPQQVEDVSGELDELLERALALGLLSVAGLDELTVTLAYGSRSKAELLDEWKVRLQRWGVYEVSPLANSRSVSPATPLLFSTPPRLAGPGTPGTAEQTHSMSSAPATAAYVEEQGAPSGSALEATTPSIRSTTPPRERRRRLRAAAALIAVEETGPIDPVDPAFSAVDPELSGPAAEAVRSGRDRRRRKRAEAEHTQAAARVAADWENVDGEDSPLLGIEARPTTRDPGENIPLLGADAARAAHDDPLSTKPVSTAAFSVLHRPQSGGYGRVGAREPEFATRDRGTRDTMP